MAISRSFGGRSLTTRSPMEIVPVPGSSNPAIIRRAVDLPHPEGPTRMVNSLSSTMRLKSFTAWTVPKCFETFSRITLSISIILLFAMSILQDVHSSTFHSAQHKTFNKFFLKNEKENEHGSRHKCGCRHQQGPVPPAPIDHRRIFESPRDLPEGLP